MRRQSPPDRGIQPVHYDEGGQEEALSQALARTDLALYKSPGHWERIEA
ncbi:hypothetical protein MFUL124B02_19855 [Myxococcus fulvus 124B02]|nr:hypothetical protein MFUL124B02_19855 [Myxococcus fulvus 124B02]